MNIMEEDTYMKKQKMFKLNLQFFADGADSSSEGVQGAEQAIGEQLEGQEQKPLTEQNKSFDDVLKDKAMQAEFDRRISKALATQKAKNDEANKKAIQDALTEAEKLAKMKDDEKAEYERQKREDDYNKRMAELTARELKATAKENLASEGLPLELAEVLNYQDADSCNKSIEAVKTAFQSAVSKAVNEKLKGKGAPKTGDAATGTLEAQIAKAVRGQI